MNYQIIRDEARLQAFIDWLPELGKDEIWYVTLFARKKYFSALKHDKAQLKRFVSRKDLLLSKIKQLQCQLGSYAQDKLEIPNEALSLYISINPRSLEQATKNALINFALNELQTTIGTRHFYDLDFDHVDLDESLIKINEVISPDHYTVLKTRGGFHLLIHINQLTEVEEKRWYSLTKLPGCDVKGDTLIPVPGCAQGDFTPYLIL